MTSGDSHPTSPSSSTLFPASVANVDLVSLQRAKAISRYGEMVATFALNIQVEQEVRIECDILNRPLAYAIATAAYRLGAKYVDLQVNDNQLSKIRLDETKNIDNLRFVPPWIKSRVDHWVDNKIARVYIDGDSEPDLLSTCDAPRKAAMLSASSAARKRFFAEGINEHKVHWTVIAAPTPAWAGKVFPGQPLQEAYDKLWDEILSACRVDTEDWRARWEQHNAKLLRRCQRLNELNISELHFEAPGTNLKVGLLPESRFHGGSDVSDRGHRFNPNVPTEEVYTTPDAGKTSGTVTLTRPVLIQGVLVEGLVLSFKAGVLESFTASKGTEVLAEYFKTDAGASRLGEVALVGVDSPIFKSGLLFYNTLFDENAACHVAFGKAYSECVAGYSALSEEEVIAKGINESDVHDDVMISSADVDVFGLQRDGTRVPLLLKGAWVEGF